MGWYYKSPQKFPAEFTRVLIQASNSPDEAIILGVFNTREELDEFAERFRWFRWCIRKEPDAARQLTSILDSFEVRASSEVELNSHILRITARPTKVSEFERLNPELTSSIQSYLKD